MKPAGKGLKLQALPVQIAIAVVDKGGLDVVEVHEEMADQSAGITKHSLQKHEPLPPFPDFLQKGSGHAPLQTMDMVSEKLPVRDNRFSGRRRGGGPQVCNEINNSKVNFVADGRDNRNFRGIRRPRHRFFVKRPEVFNGAAATA